MMGTVIGCVSLIGVGFCLRSAFEATQSTAAGLWLALTGVLGVTAAVAFN